MASHYLQPFFLSDMSLFWSEKHKKRGGITEVMVTSFACFAAQNKAYSDEYGGCK